MSDDAVSETSNDTRRGLMQLGEHMTAILDAMDGYKAQLEERGYSPGAVERMVADYHHHLLAVAFRQPSASA